MLTVSARGHCKSIYIFEDGIQVAYVHSDWTELEACVVELRSETDKPGVAKLLKDYWPRLTIVWPEQLTIILA